MATTDDAHPGGDSITRLAALLDADGIDLDRLRRDFPDWRIWYSPVSGCHHARRVAEGGRFTERETDGRRFHVSATTPGRLALLLLAQVAMDAENDPGAL